MLKFLLITILLIFPSAITAQTETIKGKVMDEKGQTISNASIQIIGSGMGCLTGSSGKFVLSKINLGQHKIEVRAFGYFTIEKNISIKSKSVEIDFVLEEDSKTLAGVTVIAPTVEREMLRLPENITVINTKPFYNSNQGVLNILRRTSGIKIRTNGGYGARTDFYINGNVTPKNFCDYSKTNLNDYLNYLKYVQQYNEKVKEFYLKRTFQDNKITVEDYQENYPKFNY